MKPMIDSDSFDKIRHRPTAADHHQSMLSLSLRLQSPHEVEWWAAVTEAMVFSQTCLLVQSEMAGRPKRMNNHL